MQRINLAVEVMGVSWGEGEWGEGGWGGGVKKLKYKGRRKERKIW